MKLQVKFAQSTIFLCSVFLILFTVIFYFQQRARDIEHASQLSGTIVGENLDHSLDTFAEEAVKPMSLNLKQSVSDSFNQIARHLTRTRDLPKPSC